MFMKVLERTKDKFGTPWRVRRSGRNQVSLEHYSPQEGCWVNDHGIFIGHQEPMRILREILKVTPPPERVVTDDDIAQIDEGYHPVKVTTVRHCRRCFKMMIAGTTAMIRKIDRGWLVLCGDCYSGPTRQADVGEEVEA